MAIDHNIDMICIQEHRYIHSKDIRYHYTSNEWMLVSASAWKNSVNAMIGGVGMLIGPQALKLLNSIKKIQPMMVATFNSNPSATIIFATALPMLVKKLTSSPSITSYPPLSIASRNTTFLSSVKT